MKKFLIFLLLASCANSPYSDDIKKNVSIVLDKTHKDFESRYINEIKQTKKPIVFGAETYDSKEFKIRYGVNSFPANCDYKQNLDSISLEELRYMKFYPYAKNGHLFNDAVIRNYYNRTNWYQPVYWTKTYNKLNEKDRDFYNRVLNKEKELLKNNFIIKNKSVKVNTDNIINKSQFDNIDEEYYKLLKNNGFAISGTEYYNKLHTLYVSNDYGKIPTFVTCDLYLHLFHIYFSYILRTLEEKQFIPILKNLCLEMHKASTKYANSADENLKNAAEFNMYYYAVPYYLLTGKKLELPTKYRDDFKLQVTYIKQANSIEWKSPLFDGLFFDYSLCKPRGNYTRTEALKSYFRAMMWLQSAPFSTKMKHHMQRMALSAYILANHKNKKREKLIDKYMAINETSEFIMGKSDNLSVTDMIEIMKNNKITAAPEQALKEENIDRITSGLLAMNKEKMKFILRAVPGSGFSVDTSVKINFMPQRYNVDGDILSRLINLTDDQTRRAFPKALDVFAAFGNEKAEGILLNYHKENQRWPRYADSLNSIKRIFKDYDFSTTLYDTWISNLNSLFEFNSDYPYFMRLEPWEKKNLNAGLASWAELKHDAILYAEQPVAAEGGEGLPAYDLPPAARMPGYVEPNIVFWNNCIKIMDKTVNGLKKYNLLTKRMERNSKIVLEFADFYKKASELELKRELLPDEYYMKIKNTGHDYESIIIEMQNYSINVNELKDEEMFNYADPEPLPVIADVFTTNEMCLEVAVGRPLYIYVVVEIGGYLYLTRGGIYSYHAFIQPVSNRLTDEEWRKMLEEQKAPKPVQWMENLKASHYLETNYLRENPSSLEPW